MQKITPFLWFDTQAEEAARFYTSVFPDSSIDEISRYGESGPGPAGSVMVVSFTLVGQRYTALNGGPHFAFNQAVSFVVNCESQEEVDRYWDALLADGGKPIQCGWLTDKFGLPWQITPTVLVELLSDPDAAKSQRVMKAMMEMVKIDIPTLQRAAEEG